VPQQPQDYAIVIGLNDYPSFGARGRPLDGAIEDATRFGLWLTDGAVGGGLPEANCKLIRSTTQPLGPTREAIDIALDAILTRAEETGGRRLYFYFSGHGQARLRDDVALCLSHWSTIRFRHAALSSESYRDMLLRCSPFSELVILLDCCRIRSVDATGLASEIGCAVPVDDAGSKRFLVGYAAEFQSAAMEAEAAGGAGLDDEGPIVRGHFTEALLSGLYGGAARDEGGVTARGLKRYLENNVPRIARASDHQQIAQVVLDFPEDAQPVFGSALPQTNARIAFLPQRRGAILLEGPELRLIREDDAATGPWELMLEPGLHRLVERGTGEEMVLRFQPRGEVTNVAF
jgi:Caspase domain